VLILLYKSSIFQITNSKDKTNYPEKTGLAIKNPPKKQPNKPKKKRKKNHLKAVFLGFIGFFKN
jgi:hypothetical protein